MGLQILLVEDNDLNRDMLSRRLRRAGYTVAVAVDGAEALQSIAALRPDVVLLDMNLPVKDGWSTCRELRATPAIAATPVIALTAHAMLEDQRQALAAGCNDYATKPVDFQALLASIERLSRAEGNTT